MHVALPTSAEPLLLSPSALHGWLNLKLLDGLMPEPAVWLARSLAHSPVTGVRLGRYL
jgi:hypothetical protein